MSIKFDIFASLIISFMQQYLNLLDRVLKEGVKKEDRTGTGLVGDMNIQENLILENYWKKDCSLCSNAYIWSAIVY